MCMPKNAYFNHSYGSFDNDAMMIDFKWGQLFIKTSKKAPSSLMSKKTV